ncbi:hypothetical protein [Tabrizicola sp.]|uniref:hypothetical protein n=1 Tax=Tabrizicola sp. TaxID=2005166 RepID=UPI002FDD29DE
MEGLLRSLVVMASLALAGQARADAEDRMIVLDLSEGVGLQSRPGELGVGPCACGAAAGSLKTKNFNLYLVGKSALKDGGTRFVLSIAPAQKARMQLQVDELRAALPGEDSPVGYSLHVSFCRMDGTGAQPVSFRWRVTDGEGKPIKDKEMSGKTSIDTSTPVCAR